MSRNEVLIGSILGPSAVAALYRVGEDGDAGGALAASVKHLVKVIYMDHDQMCSRCGDAPGTQKIPDRSGVYCPNCWYGLYGERAAEQELAKQCSCAGCDAESSAGRFHNQFGLPDLQKWDDAWLCESCLVGIMKRLARLLLKEFDKAPQKKVGECACCGEVLQTHGFKVYLNWRRDRIPKELVSLVRWKDTVLCGECGRMVRAINSVLVPISDEDRKKGRKHPFWTGRFDVELPAPVLDGAEPAPEVATQEVAETTATLVTATA